MRRDVLKNAYSSIDEGYESLARLGVIVAAKGIRPAAARALSQIPRLAAFDS